MDEHEAIERLRQGDIGGLETLVRTHQVCALRAAYLITRDRSQAKDIVQNAFLRVGDRIGQFAPSRPFGPWFLKIVVNDAVKAVTRDRHHLSLDEDRLEGDESADALPARDADPAESLLRAETQQEVAAALARLTPRQRAAVVLRYYAGLSESEMVDELGWPRSGVKWHLHAARKRLAELLAALRPTHMSRLVEEPEAKR